MRASLVALVRGRRLALVLELALELVLQALTPLMEPELLSRLPGLIVGERAEPLLTRVREVSTRSDSEDVLKKLRIL